MLKFEKNISALTLVEILLILSLLIIILTISFLSFSSYQKNARDSKRLVDIRNIYSKVNFEYAKGKRFNNLIIHKQYNDVLIDGKAVKVSQGPVDFSLLQEKEKNFLDPLDNSYYPMAYSIGSNGKKGYIFLQIRTISEVKNQHVVIGHYYKFRESDSESLFVYGSGTIVDGADINGDTQGPKDDVIKGICGENNGKNLTQKPTENLCTKGLATEVTDVETKTGAYTWKCSGVDCSANKVFYTCFGNQDISNATIINTENLSKNTQYQVDNPSGECYIKCNDGLVWKENKCLNEELEGIPEGIEFGDGKYPGCNTNDIVIRGNVGGVLKEYHVAACNVGASIANEYAKCTGTVYSCTTERAGFHFQWGRNKGFEIVKLGASIRYSDQISQKESYGGPSYGFVYHQNLCTPSYPFACSWASGKIITPWGNPIKGPCADGYHIPTKDEGFDL